MYKGVSNVTIIINNLISHEHPLHFSDYAKHLNDIDYNLPFSSAVSTGTSRLQDSSCKFNRQYLCHVAIKINFTLKIKLNRQHVPCLFRLKYAANISQILQKNG